MTADQIQALKYALADAEQDRDRACATLRDRAVRIRENMDSLVRRLDRGGSVNSLGEIQGSGGDLDRACAVLHEREEQVNRMRFVCQRLASTNHDLS
jgi:hypothetical protein